MTVISTGSITIVDLTDGVNIFPSPLAFILPSKDGVNPILTGNKVVLSVKNRSSDETANWKFYVSGLTAGTTYYDSGNTSPRSGVGKTNGALSASNVSLASTSGSGTITVCAYRPGSADISIDIPISIGVGGQSGAVSVPTYTAALSSPAQVLKADAAGGVIDYSPATTSVTVFRGSSDDTANWTFTRSIVSGVTSSMVDANTLTVTNLTVDSAVVTLTGTRTDPVNLVPNSSDFSTYTIYNTAPVKVQTVPSPAGDGLTYRMQEVVADSVSPYIRYLAIQSVGVCSQALTASVYLRYGTRRYALVRIVNSTRTHQANAIIDLKTGEVVGQNVVGSFVISDVSVEAVAGWWRVYLTASAAGVSDAALLWVNSCEVDGTTSITGAAKYFYIWGAQLDTAGGATFSKTASPITLKYSIAKSVAGSDAKSLVLSASSQVFRVGADSTVNPKIITFTAKLQNMTGTPVWSVIAGSGTLSSSGTTATLAYDSVTTSAVTVSATLNGLSDSITVVVLASNGGEPAYTLVASNQSHTLPASSDGVVSNYTGASDTLTIYRDGVDDSANWTLTKVDTNVTSSVSGRTVTVTAMTDASVLGRVDITATRVDPVNIFPASASEVFTAWTPTRATVTSASATDPFGGTDGFVILDDATAANTHYIRYSGVSFVASTPYTFSVFLKARGWSRARLNLGSNILGGSGTPSLTCSLVGTASITGAANVSASGIESCGNGWWRLWGVVTATASTTSGVVDIITVDDAGNAIHDGDTAKGVRVFGMNITPTATLQEYSHVAPTLSSRFSISKAKAGVDGTNGVRGSRWFYVATTGTTYNTTLATTTASVNGGPIMMDTVVQYNSTAGFSETRYWSGSAWVVVNTVIDGNLLVKGSVGADTFNGGKMNVGKYIASSNWNGVVNASGVITTPGTQGWIIVSGNGTTVPSSMEIDAATIRGQLVANQIAANAISTGKLTDNAVTTRWTADNSWSGTILAVTQGAGPFSLGTVTISETDTLVTGVVSVAIDTTDITPQWSEIYAWVKFGAWGGSGVKLAHIPGCIYLKNGVKTTKYAAVIPIHTLLKPPMSYYGMSAGTHTVSIDIGHICHNSSTGAYLEVPRTYTVSASLSIVELKK